MKEASESFLRKSLEGSDTDVHFAALFGSYGRGKYDAFSDVDIFVVCRDERGKSVVKNRLNDLSFRLNREIHPNLFTLDEFKNRLRLHDYLLASILEDSIFLFGDIDCYAEGRRSILGGKPEAESVNFNRNMCEKVLGYADDCLRRLQDYSKASLNQESYCITRGFLLDGVKNYHLALGYLLASEEMRRLNNAVSLRRLLRLQTNPLLENLISTEKSIRRATSISLPAARNLCEATGLDALSAFRELAPDILLRTFGQSLKERTLSRFNTGAFSLSERST